MTPEQTIREVLIDKMQNHLFDLQDSVSAMEAKVESDQLEIGKLETRAKSILDEIDQLIAEQKTAMETVTTQNPHWIGGYPAWDITLPTGEIDEGVSMVEIKVVHNKMYNDGLLPEHERYINVVNQKNVNNYAAWRKNNERTPVQ